MIAAAAFAACFPATTCGSSGLMGSTGCSPAPPPACAPPHAATAVDPCSAPLRRRALPASRPETYARSWHRPFAPCSLSPIFTCGAAAARDEKRTVNRT